MNTAYKKILIALIILVTIGVLVSIMMRWISTKHPIQQLPPIQTKISPSVAPTASSTPSVPVAGTVGTKIYHNEEFSFEFQYPEDWKVEEETFYSPFSKFNLILLPVEGMYLPDPILVNIVTPDFAQRAFSDLEGTGSKTIIAGVWGTRYEYQNEGLAEIGIVLPFGENRILLGAKKNYEVIFNQILASFKFLK